MEEQDHRVQHEVDRKFEENKVGKKKDFSSHHRRVTIKISCRMDFNNYPFDKHICKFKVGSCEYSTTDIQGVFHFCRL